MKQKKLKKMKSQDIASFTIRLRKLEKHLEDAGKEAEIAREAVIMAGKAVEATEKKVEAAGREIAEITKKWMKE